MHLKFTPDEIDQVDLIADQIEENTLNLIQ
jgi:hypothetical protein